LFAKDDESGETNGGTGKDIRAKPAENPDVYEKIQYVSV
jgi:hypothetical protein